MAEPMIQLNQRIKKAYIETVNAGDTNLKLGVVNRVFGTTYKNEALSQLTFIPSDREDALTLCALHDVHGVNVNVKAKKKCTCNGSNRIEFQLSGLDYYSCYYIKNIPPEAIKSVELHVDDTVYNYGSESSGAFSEHPYVQLTGGKVVVEIHESDNNRLYRELVGLTIYGAFVLPEIYDLLYNLPYSPPLQLGTLCTN